MIIWIEIPIKIFPELDKKTVNYQNKRFKMENFG